jgi:protein-disulfide isomerase
MPNLPLSVLACLLVLLAAPRVAAPAPATAPAAAPTPTYGSSLGLDKNAARPPPDLAALVPQVDIRGRPMLGDPAAPVTIVEFIDYECPFCQGYAQDTWPQLKANYVETGKLRYVVLDFPLGRHEHARPAAIAAACAGEQGRYWEMHQALLDAGGQLLDAELEAQGRRLGLDAARFASCRADGRHQARLDADIAAARAVGARGTPSFLVGASAGDVARGRLLQGDEDYAAFEKLLARYLGTPAQ